MDRLLCATHANRSHKVGINLHGEIHERVLVEAILADRNGELGNGESALAIDALVTEAKLVHPGRCSFSILAIESARVSR